MTAPPQVQAHNFARAILTDIPNTPFQAGKAAIGKSQSPQSCPAIDVKMPTRERSAMSLTTFFGLMGRLRAVPAAFVPFVDKVLGRVNILVAASCSAAL